MILGDGQMSEEPLVFALSTSQPFGVQVAAELGLTLAPHEEHRYESGESKLRPLVCVRGRDVYVLHALHADRGASVHDKLCELLFFIATVRDAGAAYVTAVLPYLCYARKDRRTKSRDPVTTRYVAQLLESAGVNCVAALDVHNRQAFDNAFRCRTEHLEARIVLAEALLPLLDDRPLTVVSPDSGGTKRAELFRQALTERVPEEPGMAFVEKYRHGDVVSGGRLIGDVEGRVAVIVDDMISTGATLRQAATTCRAHGAAAVYAAVTHGLFAADAEALLTGPGLDRLLVTNSVAPEVPQAARGKVGIVPIEPLFARAISALYTQAESPALES